MSDLRIALVAEGPTDAVIIEAALKAILSEPFILTPLQPEATRPGMGSGWSGVLKWCNAASQRHSASLDADLTLEQFDLLIVHLDADVSSERYANAGPGIESLAIENGWGSLPCVVSPCPPVSATVQALTAVLDSWLRPASRGSKTALCLPAQSSGAWLAAAILPVEHAFLNSPECNTNLESNLALLPKKQRIRKSASGYRQHASQITTNWLKIKGICTQAVAFESAVLAVL